MSGAPSCARRGAAAAAWIGAAVAAVRLRERHPRLRPLAALGAVGSPVAGRVYPAAVREQFLQSCIASAKTDRAKAEGYCNCALKKIEERFSVEEFVQLSLEMASTGKVPDKLLPAITDCISFLL